MLQKNDFYMINTMSMFCKDVDTLDKLFKENNDHYFCGRNESDIKRIKRAVAFKQGIKSKSLDIFDRPTQTRC